MGFQAKGVGNDIGGLPRSHERAGEYGIKGYPQTAQPARCPPHPLDSFRSERPFAVRLHTRLVSGDCDAMAH
jgi:hypothetical protein